MSKFYSIIKYLIGWPLSIVALFFVFKVIFSNTYKALPSIHDINFLLLFISIVILITYFFLRAKIWMLLLGEKGKQFSFKENMLHWSTSELKRYVPGNIWSFIARTTSFEKDNLSKEDILFFIAHEAVIICISSLILSVFYLLNFQKSQFVNNSVFIFILISMLTFIFSLKIVNLIPGENKLSKFLKLLLPAQSSFINFKILLLGILTFFIYGLGIYFSMISIFYVDIKYILILISLFNFAFFIGYVSFVTPMGLGVREGVTTLGLSYFLVNASAALVSLFSRIVLILSELISLFLVILWNKLKFLKRVEDFIYKHKYEVILGIFVFIYILYFTLASFLRYDNFYTGRFDLGNMDQTVWNTIHGRIFQLTDPDGTNNISRLSVHADFILILISPLYLIWSNPKMLLLFQTVVLAFGAIFIYLISNNLLKNKNISIAFVFCFFLNPALQYTNLYDFHPVTLATTFLLATFYFYLRKKYILFILFATLAGLTKEELWAVVGIIGLFIAFRAYLENKKLIKWKSILVGVFFFLAGISTTYILVSKIIPYIKGSDHFALTYYSDFGSSTVGIFKNIVFNPLKTLSIIFEQSRLYFIYQLFSPLGFLSLLSPLILIFTLPDLFIDLLSNNTQLHQIYYQYTAVITPFIFISAVYSSKIILQRFKKINYQHIAVYIIVTTLISAYLTGPLPGSQRPNIDMFSKQLVNSKTVDNFISFIPKRYGIAASNNIASHLSRRENIYIIPNGINSADVIIFLLNDRFAQPSLSAQKQMAQNLKSDPKYTMLFADKDFFAFAKKSANVHLRKIRM